jgi:acetyl esterase/lipase
VHNDRYPAILVLHGGGWRHGDKGGLYAPHHRELAAQGYVVFDAQYRLTVKDGERWPAQLDDVRAAIRWVKANADDYNIDPERIVLMGRSAGGHIALEAAYRATGEYADTRVCAVVGYYAPTNLRLTRAEHDERVLMLLGDTSYNIPDVYADASPLDFAGGDSPATLLLHGTMDSLVTPIHTELLVNRLRSCRVPVVALRIPWGRHAFDLARLGMGARMSQRHVDRFLAWAVSRNNHHAG